MAGTVILRSFLKCPDFFAFRKVQKMTHSALKRVFKLLFFKATKKTLGTDFVNSKFGECLVVDCISTFFSQYYFVLILFNMQKDQGISKMALELVYLV